MAPSPVYLLLSKTPFHNFRSELPTYVESLRTHPFDAREEVDGVGLLEAFLSGVMKPHQVTPNVFVHDVISLLVEKGAPVVVPARASPGAPQALGLLRLYKNSPATPEALAQMRVGAELLDEMWPNRSGTEALGAVDKILSRPSSPSSIEGLPPAVWLALQSGPTDSWLYSSSSGWAFEGSRSEQVSHSVRVLRGLRARVLDDSSISPGHAWILEAGLLSLALLDGVPSVIREFQRTLKSISRLPPDSLSEAYDLALGLDASLRARVAAVFLRAGQAMGGVLHGRFEEDAKATAEDVAVHLLFYGLSLAKDGPFWMLDREEMAPLARLDLGSQKTLVPRLMALPGGPELVFEWLGVTAPEPGVPVPIGMQNRKDLFLNALTWGLANPKRALDAMESVWPTFEKALSQDEPLAQVVKPLLARIKSAHLGATLPTSPKGSSAKPRL